MPSLTLVGLLCFCWAVVNSEPLYKKAGDSLTLPGFSVNDPVTGIVWKHGTDLAMEWDGRDIDSYRQFKDRGILNITTGELTLTGLIKSDSGLYAVEINNRLVNRTEIRVISPVPKPRVSSSCGAEHIFCLLSCDGDTTDAEPFTYAWRKDSGGATNNVIENDLSKEYSITKEVDLSYKGFRCSLENPVSQETSETIVNPLIQEPQPGLHLQKGLIVLFSLLGGLAVLIFIHRWLAGAWFYETAYMPWEAGFWRKQQETAREDDSGEGSATGNGGVATNSIRGEDNVEAPESSGASGGKVELKPEAEEVLMTQEGEASPGQEP
ncbi:lymphocyte function-associated antigen 3-like isoform 3-T4 [Polymixia lowei]